VHVELLSIDGLSQPGTRPDACWHFSSVVAWPPGTICGHVVLVLPTSLNVGRPRLLSQIVPCMSLVLDVCSDCCCHIVQEKKLHFAVRVWLGSTARPAALVCV
jgi:hypothetical protein